MMEIKQAKNHIRNLIQGIGNISNHDIKEMLVAEVSSFAKQKVEQIFKAYNMDDKIESLVRLEVQAQMNGILRNRGENGREWNTPSFKHMVDREIQRQVAEILANTVKIEIKGVDQ